MYKRIIVPLDGSELAEQAVPHAEELSQRLGAPLHLVRITDVHNPGQYGAYLALDAAGYTEAVESDEAEAKRYLENLGRALAARGLPVSVEHRHGRPAKELAALAQTGDLVVMATHGRGGLGRAFMGSVADEIVRHSIVPVLLVRTREEQPNQSHVEQPMVAVGYEPW
jgi:nucleotide-binding universal stress UspA family protein